MEFQIFHFVPDLPSPIVSWIFVFSNMEFCVMEIRSKRLPSGNPDASGCLVDSRVVLQDTNLTGSLSFKQGVLSDCGSVTFLNPSANTES